MAKSNPKKSKRITLKNKYRVLKKAKDRAKKLKKFKKLHPEKFRKRKSDPGVPHSVPFKEMILEHASQLKEADDCLKQKHREMMKQWQIDDETKKGKKRSLNELYDLVLTDKERELYYTNRQSIVGIPKSIHGRTEVQFVPLKSRYFYRDFTKVVQKADLIVQVLDARDPIGTRCAQFEKYIGSYPEKQLAFILAKTDLVLKENVEEWLEYLRKLYPTLAYRKAFLGKVAPRYFQVDGKRLKRLPTNDIHPFAGIDFFLRFLSNYAQNKSDLGRPLVVGIVGVPNVGKLSLLQTLREKGYPEEHYPEYEQSVNLLKVSDVLHVINTPGLITPNKDIGEEELTLECAYDMGKYKNIVAAIEVIVELVDKEELMNLYQINPFNDTEEFLTFLAIRRGLRGEGGWPNLKKAAKLLLNDWMGGKIKHITEPPGDGKSPQVEFSCSCSQFNLKELAAEESNYLSLIAGSNFKNIILVEAGAPIPDYEPPCQKRKAPSWTREEAIEELYTRIDLRKNIPISGYQLLNDDDLAFLAKDIDEGVNTFAPPKKKARFGDCDDVQKVSSLNDNIEEEESSDEENENTSNDEDTSDDENNDDSEGELLDDGVDFPDSDESDQEEDNDGDT